MSTKTDDELTGTKERKSPKRVAKAAKKGPVKSRKAAEKSGKQDERGAEESEAKKGTSSKQAQSRAKVDEAVEGSEAASGADEKSGPVRPLTEAGRKRLVNKLLGLADSQATQGAFKITPADLIRLMQLHKELNPEKNRKVTVQWIEDKPE